MAYDLPFLFGIAVAFGIAMYVISDGFDLGIGILFLLAPSDADRDIMMNSVAPIWDGNETWLVLGGTMLIGAFPVAYATILPAPLSAADADAVRPDLSRGRVRVPVSRRARGGAYGTGRSAPARSSRRLPRVWRSAPTSTALRWRTAGLSAAPMGSSAALRSSPVSGLSPAMHCWAQPGSSSRPPAPPSALDARRRGRAWCSRSLSCWRSASGRRCGMRQSPSAGSARRASITCGSRRLWRWPRPTASGARSTASATWCPFLLAIALFLLALLGLGITLWPYAVPYSVTLWQAASSTATLEFLGVGTVAIIPIILVYLGYAHRVFRGKTQPGTGYGN